MLLYGVGGMGTAMKLVVVTPRHRPIMAPRHTVVTTEKEPLAQQLNQTAVISAQYKAKRNGRDESDHLTSDA